MKELQSDLEFAQLVEESNSVVLVDFMASWCNPCKNLSKELEQLKNINIVKVDIEKLPIVTEQYGIMGVPTLAIFKNGEMIDRITGYRPKEAIEEWVKGVI